MNDLIERLRVELIHCEMGKTGNAALYRRSIKALEAYEARIAQLEGALRWYADQMCEGLCDKDPIAASHIGGENCAGCPARQALTSAGEGK